MAAGPMIGYAPTQTAPQSNFSDDSSPDYSSYSYSYIYDYEYLYVALRLNAGAVKTLAVVFTLGVIISAVGNIVVFVTITCAKNGKTSFNTFILNLAISDWSLSLICVPFIFSHILIGEWIFGDVICRLALFTLKVSEVVSIFTLAAICLDRYRAIMYPFKEKLSPKKKIFVVTLIWISAAFICCPYYIYHSVTTYPTYSNGTIRQCRAIWPSSTAIDFKEAFVWAIFLSTYMVPLLILGVCYIRAAVKVWRRKVPGAPERTGDKRQAKVKRKAMTTLISAVVLFAVSWLPLHLYNIVLTYKPEYLIYNPKETMVTRACVLIWMIISDSILNPIMYVFISDRFRRDMCRMFLTCRRAVKRFKVNSSVKEISSFKTMSSDMRRRSQWRSSALVHTMKTRASKDGTGKVSV